MATTNKKSEAHLDTGAYRVLVRPITSEKSYTLNPLGKYVFKVSAAANKISVRKAVQQVYGVTVVRVNILNVRGKVRAFGKTSGRTSAWKKAVVTLKDGQSIPSLNANGGAQ